MSIGTSHEAQQFSEILSSSFLGCLFRRSQPSHVPHPLLSIMRNAQGLLACQHTCTGNDMQSLAVRRRCTPCGTCDINQALSYVSRRDRDSLLSRHAMPAQHHAALYPLEGLSFSAFVLGINCNITNIHRSPQWHNRRLATSDPAVLCHLAILRRCLEWDTTFSNRSMQLIPIQS